MFYIGLDLGKAPDHSAVAVVERMDWRRGYENPVFAGMHVRYLERVPLGTPYSRVVEHVRAMATSRELEGRCSLVVDATGVGEAVVDMLRAARLGCEVMAVKITGGERESETGSTCLAPKCNVPKQDLIAGVQVLLENGELKIARRLREAGALAKELVDVRLSAMASGRVRIGADGFGQHDDLVIALALAVWKGRKVRGTIGPVAHRLF